MKIICIGRNYSQHSKELGNPVPKEPVLFLKPETALLPKNHPFIIPSFTRELHYETELVVRISRLGRHIDEQFAHRYYSEIGLGIDFTARDVQNKLKEKGLPWEKAKAFDHSAPVGSEFLSLSEIEDKGNINFHLEKNGKTVQAGNSSEMIFSFDRLVAYASTFFTLKHGDLLFTGTPAGVGPVEKGDDLAGFIGDKQLLRVKVR